jgi:multidrug transporter EmrE-like cation transporter
MNNLLLILTSVTMGAVGQVLLKMGAGKLSNFSLTFPNIFASIISILKVPEIIIGLMLFGSSFLLWVKVLTSNELSYAYPMVSLGYVITAAFSFLLFRETFTLNKLLGILMIVSGVFFINR